MKQILAIAAFMIVAAGAAAQNSPTDTVKTQKLEEVVVQAEAPKVIRKSDMDVYHPSKGAIANSKNGMQVLSNLMIPALTVNEPLNSITANGESVQIRINGRVASVDQVKNLLPETIKRIEWMDNPGLRYAGASYVLNIIVSNPSSGGSFMGTVSNQALNSKFGYYMAQLSLNSGRSQWSVGNYFKLAEDIKAHRDYKEKFTYPDGSSLARIERPLGGEIDNTTGNAWITYEYVKPDTTVFYLYLGGYREFSGGTKYSGILSLSNSSEEILLDNGDGKQGTTPYFSAYFEQHFAKKQTLVADVGISMYDGHKFSDYQESMMGAGDYLTDIHAFIEDRNKSYAMETDYIKQWDKSKFTTGISFKTSRNHSTYRHLNNAVFHQRDNSAYFFTEYYHRFGKLALTAGIGIQYTDFLFKESNQGNDSWNLRPQVTLAYSLNSKNKFRLTFHSWRNTPSLDQTNVAPQQVDGFQWHIGNPDLKAYDHYELTFRYSFSLPHVNANFSVSAAEKPDMIAPCLYWDSDRLIKTYENARGQQSLLFSFAPQIEVVPGWLMASGSIAYMAERMRGSGYTRYNHNWSGNVNLMVTHWNFVFSTIYRKSPRVLSGEEISWGEDISAVDLSYTFEKWQFGAGVLMPFGKYDQGSKLFNKYNTNAYHMRPDLKIPYLSVRYNLEWGRRKSNVDKLVNADASVEQSKISKR